jgi:CHAT domain-containing protein
MTFDIDTPVTEVISYMLSLDMEKFDAFFRDNPHLFIPAPMDNLLVHLDGWPKEQDDVQRLELILKFYRDHCYLNTFLNLGTQEEQWAYVNAAPDKLLTNFNYSILKKYYLNASDNTTAFLTRSKAILCQFAGSQLLQSSGKLPFLRKMLVERIEWLLDPLTKEYFQAIRLDFTEPKDVAIIEDFDKILEDCLQEGTEEAIRKLDVRFLLYEMPDENGPGRRANLHQIIDLTVDKDKELWANASIDLGLAYSTATGLPPKECAALAMKFYEQSLSFFTVDKHPQWWAIAKNRLGSEYEKLKDGDQMANQEKAIELFREVLPLLLTALEPAAWALARFNLAVVYANRLKGQRSENCEETIRFADEALKVYTPDMEPYYWAKAQNLIGLAYQNRLLGFHKDNLEKSLYHHNQALQVFSRDKYPVEWAMVQNNLGVAYKNKPSGLRSENLLYAAACFKCALEIRTLENQPLEWCRTLFNYGNLCMLDEMPGDNHEEARSAFNQILEASHTAKFSPYFKASALNSLGISYINHLDGQLNNLKKGAAYLQQGLSLVSLDEYPRLYRNLSMNLGGTLHDLKEWHAARMALEQAVRAVELIRKESTHLESRKFLAAENAVMMSKLVNCCLRQDDYTAALEYATMNKSRSFTETLAQATVTIDELRTGDPELAAAFDQMTTLQTELNELMLSTFHNKPALQSDSQAEEHLIKLNLLRSKIKEGNEELLFRFPALINLQSLPLLTVSDIQQLAKDLGDVTIIDYVEHNEGWGAFVVTGEAIRFTSLDDDFREELTGSLNLLVRDQFWEQPDWNARLKKMHDLLIAPVEQYLPASGKLIISPANLTHLIPFQALIDRKGCYLSERYVLIFTQGISSLYRLYELQKQAHFMKDSRGNEKLLNVACSGTGKNYLPSVISEAIAIEKHFESSLRLFEEDTLASNIIKSITDETFAVIHINTHGYFDFEDPGASGLLLAQNTVLSVEDIRLHVRLRGYPLVTLSACQTGQIRPERGEETPGIAWSFLTAGASSVISSQWSVYGQSTKELFEHFYRIRASAILSDAEALSQAMQALRKKKAYANQPFYWAAFQVIGLP